jgi:hypothetical protein
MNLLNLNSFLKFGYFMDYKYPDYQVNFTNFDKNKYFGFEEKELIEIGQNLWFQTISKQINNNNQNVVPLSGGLDSRAILGSLLEHKNASEIHTYTFGTPNTLDYEIGNKIAKLLGTNHKSFPLNEYIYNTKNLVEISNRIDNQTLLFLHPSVENLDLNFSEFNVWSGAIIDVFFGRHKHKKTAKNLNGGILNSINENIYSRSVNLTNIPDSELDVLFDYDFTTEHLLEYEYVLDILNRQLKYIAPHVLMRGFNYKTLLDDSLIDFALSLNEKFINDQYLYKKIFFKSFPYLFSLPCKTSNGIPLNSSRTKFFMNNIKQGMNSLGGIFNKNHVNPGINYIDFNMGIRERNDLKSVIYENINDLKSRKIVEWINIEKIWKDHINYKNNHGEALLTLASLEIHLKAGKKL